MEVVATTFVGLFIAALIPFASAEKRLVVLGLALPFSAASVVNLPSFGDTSITVPVFVGLAFVAHFLTRRNALSQTISTATLPEPGYLLLVFLGVAIATTLIMPRLFAGAIEIFSVARIEGTSGNLVLLQPTKANVTQMFYLVQGVLVYFVIAASLRAYAGADSALNAIQAATIVHLFLAALDTIDNAMGSNLLLSWVRSANYVIHDSSDIGGLPRLIAGFSEASGFVYFTIGLFAFWLTYWTIGGANRFAGAYVLICGAAMLVSTSSSGYAALAGFLFIWAIWFFWRWAQYGLSRRMLRLLVVSLVISPFTLAFVVLIYDQSAAVRQFVDLVALSKLESDSGQVRGDWNLHALQAFWRSGMLGVGVGSVRASSLIVSQLAAVGLAGTIVFAAFFVALLRRYVRPANIERVAIVTGAKSSCIALFLLASLTFGGIDMRLPFFLCAGIISGLSVAHRPARISHPLQRGGLETGRSA